METPRLHISPFTHADAGFIVTLLNSPGWLKYIGDRHVHSVEDAVAYLDHGPLKSYKDHGFGLWRVELKESGTPIGMCGLLKRAELDTPDIGFAFMPDYEGKGFASEAVAAVLDHAWKILKLSSLAAIVQADNKRSIRLLKKHGFIFEKQIVYGPKQETLDLYRLEMLGSAG